MKRGQVLSFTLSVFLVFSGAANAALIPVGTATYGGQDYNLIYEDDQGLVWLDYTKAEDSWLNQVNWASGLGNDLTVTIGPLYMTDIDWSTGWRLPETDESMANMKGGFGYEGPDTTGYHNYRDGFNMVNSEMGHLFYDSLGNLGYYDTDGNYPQDGWGLENTGPFSNLLAAYYWSGSEYSIGKGHVWHFHFWLGGQDGDDKGHIDYALAVRPGEVSPVPEPSTILLIGSGLIGLAGLRKKFRQI